MSWIAWAAVGYFMNAVALATDKALLTQRSIGNPAVYTISISALGLFVLGLVPFGFVWPGELSALYALLSGVCFTLGLWLMFTVLEHGEASRVPAFIGALSPLFVFAAAYVVLGERLGLLEVLAYLLLTSGGIAMVGGHGGLSRKHQVQATIAAAAFGLSVVFLKLVFTEASFATGLVLTRLGGFVASLLLFFIPGTWRALTHGVARSKPQAKFAFVGGQAAGALSGLLNNYAITLASVTLVNALQGVQYVFLLLLAFVISAKFPQLFKDEFSGAVALRKGVATALIIVGLWLLAWT